MPSGPDLLLSSLDIYLQSSGMEIYGKERQRHERDKDRNRQRH